MSYVYNPCVFMKWPFVQKYVSCYCRGGQPVRDQEPHFLLCYSKEPHHSHGSTWTNAISSSHIFLLS